jgi:hypothetical protein
MKAMCMLTSAVLDHQDGVKTRRQWKTEDEIEQDVMTMFLRNPYGLC